LIAYRPRASIMAGNSKFEVHKPVTGIHDSDISHVMSNYQQASTQDTVPIAREFPQRKFGPYKLTHLESTTVNLNKSGKKAMRSTGSSIRAMRDMPFEDDTLERSYEVQEDDQELIDALNSINNSHVDVPKALFVSRKLVLPK
jgi:hypothetical protein